MSLNLINANSEIFERCKSYVDRFGDFPFNRHAKVCINTSINERAWAADSKLLDLARCLEKFCLKIRVGAEFYVAFVGVNCNKLNGWPGCAAEEVHAGMFTAVLYYAKLNVMNGVSPFAIANDIMIMDHGDDVKKVPLNQLEGYFSEVNVFNVSDDRIVNMSALQLLAVAVSSSNSHYYLPYSDDVGKIFLDIAVESCNKYPYELLIYAMLSSHYKHAFLEIYRSIERLYPIPKLMEFHSSLAVDHINAISLSGLLEQHLSWRPSEEESLRELIENLSDGVRDILRGVVESDGGDSKNLSKWLYRLRNSQVHYREALRRHDMEEDRWNAIIYACLAISSFLYGKFAEDI